MKFVNIETPYMGKNQEQVRKNILYARACVRDCLNRGEIPFASHLLYTQPGITDDNIPEERDRGINMGTLLVESIPNIVTVVYQDLGISNGMKQGIERTIKNKRQIEYRVLQQGWEESEFEIAKKHSHADIWGIE